MRATKRSSFINLLIASFLILGQTLNAGVVTGRITDAGTGGYLPGANVVLEGTAFGAASDRAGTYRIPGVPPGDYTLRVSYIGYEEFTATITVPQRTLTQDAQLQASYVEMGEVVVSGLRQGAAKALSQQKSSDHIENIISSDQIESFPDFNVAEAIRRLPGVSVQQDHGEGRYILVRGTEARLNGMQINGNNIPSPEDDNRNVSMDVIPSDLLGSIEVSKAITPDMDADAIGGSVNLITKNAFDFDGRIFKADFSGGYRGLRGDIGKKATFTYGNQFMNGKLGVLIGGSYNSDDMATDDLEMGWADSYESVSSEVDEFEVDEDDITDTTFIYVVNETEDVTTLEEMEIRVYNLNRKRVGLNLNLDYKLNDNNSFYFHYLRNTFTDYEYRHLLGIDFAGSVDEEEAGSGYADPNSVVGAPIIREIKDRKSESLIQSIAVGGEHQLGLFDLDYNFSTSSAHEIRDPSRDIVFESTGYDLDYDISDHDYPTFSVTNGMDYNDLGEFEFDEFEQKDGEYTTDNDITAAVNLKMPYSFGSAVGSIKFGGKFRGKAKDSDKTTEEIWSWEGDDLDANAFETEIDGGDFMDGKYSSEVGLDPDEFADFWEGNSDFESEPGLEANYYETWDAAEDVIAVYGMTNLDFGKISVLAGARYEKTATKYNGWEGDLALAEDDESEMKAISGENDYGNFLPMFHLRYDFDDKTVIRAAFTQSMARPDYIQLVPFQAFDDGELTTGNSKLDPTLATNLDLMVEYYVGTLGIISAGYFSKTLADYIYYKIEEPTGKTYGEEEVEEWVYPVNGSEATLSGFEVQWQQQLTFLPGALSGLGIYLNYTSTQSEAKYLDRDPTTLPGQTDDVGNFGLSYDKSGFSARVSANFHGAYIDEVGGDEDEDRYYAGNTKIDLSASYSLGGKMKVYADFLNLTNAPVVYYEGDPAFPVQREVYSFGARMGIKFDF